MHPHCNLVQIAFALSNQRMDTKIEHTVFYQIKTLNTLPRSSEINDKNWST
jgi:hypothetical protein